VLARQIVPWRYRANPARCAGFALARDLPVPSSDWRKFLSHLLLSRPVLIRFVRLLALLLSVATALPAGAQVRIKDVTDVEGVRENQLVGYGLVVGLNNTGDKLDNAVFTRESLVGMLERLGVNTRD
jgi:hypothetical protein